MEVGQYTYINTDIRADVVNHYGSRTLPPGTEVRITRVATGKCMVRNESYEESYWVEKRYLGDPTGAPPGTVPEGCIDPNDPALEWMWDKISAYAENQSWCSQYDQLLRSLSLPARKRSFPVRFTVGGIEATMNVMARTQAEARERARAELNKISAGSSTASVL